MRFIAFLATLLLSGCIASAAPSESPERAPDEPLQVAERPVGQPVLGWTVQEITLPRQVRAMGTVEAREMVTLATHIAGPLTHVAGEPGDRVEAGDRVLAVESAEARDELARARAQLRFLERRIARQESLVDAGATPRSLLDELRDERDVAATEVALQTTRVRLSETRSPVSGTVVERMADPGSWVQAHTPVLQIADLDDLVVRVPLSERDVPWLTQDFASTVTVDAFPQADVRATLVRVSPTAHPTSRHVDVFFRLEAEDPTQRFVPGQLVRMALALDLEARLWIPEQSLLASRADAPFVYTIENHQLERRSVTTGLRRRGWVEVRDGLGPDETIVAMNPTTLREGQEVWIAEEQAAPAETR